MKFVLTVTTTASALILVKVLVGRPKGSQWTRPALRANVPTGHGRQRVAPAWLVNVPGKHRSHPVAPCLSIHDPGGQVKAVGVPAKKTKNPGGAGRQKLLFTMPANSLKVPGGHAVHVD